MINDIEKYITESLTRLLILCVWNDRRILIGKWWSFRHILGMVVYPERVKGQYIINRIHTVDVWNCWGSVSQSKES